VPLQLEASLLGPSFEKSTDYAEDGRRHTFGNVSRAYKRRCSRWRWGSNDASSRFGAQAYEPAASIFLVEIKQASKSFTRTKIDKIIEIICASTFVHPRQCIDYRCEGDRFPVSATCVLQFRTPICFPAVKQGLIQDSQEYEAEKALM
jgi:hypothetical protein